MWKEQRTALLDQKAFPSRITWSNCSEASRRSSALGKHPHPQALPQPKDNPPTGKPYNTTATHHKPHNNNSPMPTTEKHSQQPLQAPSRSRTPLPICGALQEDAFSFQRDASCHKKTAEQADDSRSRGEETLQLPHANTRSYRT